MSDIAPPTSRGVTAVIGLGRMGSVLAAAINASDQRVVGWSRSEATRQAFGGPTCQSVAAALGQADLAVLCLPDYASSQASLETAEHLLAGRVIVQLSSGSPQEASDLAAWVVARGGRYLDGAIATFPRRIGSPLTTIFISGDRQAWADAASRLQKLGGRIVYAGETVGAAATLDLAWLSLYYGLSMGLLQGAAFCEVGGVDPKVFLAAVPSFSVELQDAAEEYGPMIDRNDFRGNQATIAVHRAALAHLQASARSGGLNAFHVDAAAAVLDAAIAHGDAELEIAAAIRALRPQSPA